MIFPTRILAAASLAAFIPVAATAQASEEAVTIAQLTADVEAKFKRLDANGSGTFDKAEYLAARDAAAKAATAELTKVLTAEFAELDANKDQGISAAEVAAKIPSTGDGKAALARIDADKNGKVSRTEYLAQARVQPMSDADAQMRGWDGDSNGQVTLAEYKASAVANFNGLDRNKDGKVTKAEVEQASAAAPQGR